MSPDYIHYLFLLAESQGIFIDSLWEHSCKESDCDSCPAVDACSYLTNDLVTGRRSVRSFETNFDFLLRTNYEEFNKRSLKYYSKHFPEFTI